SEGIAGPLALPRARRHGFRYELRDLHRTELAVRALWHGFQDRYLRQSGGLPPYGSGAETIPRNPQAGRPSPMAAAYPSRSGDADRRTRRRPSQFPDRIVRNAEAILSGKF